MKRYGLFAACWAVLIVACASSGGSGESETHFWKCATDLDCRASEQCVVSRCVPTRAHASGMTSSEADSGADGAANTGGTTNAGGTGGAPGSSDGATNAGGTGGAQGSTGGATNGGAGGGPGSLDGSANAGGTS